MVLSLYTIDHLDVVWGVLVEALELPTQLRNARALRANTKLSACSDTKILSIQ